MNLTDRELLIALHHLPGIGPRRWYQLAETGEPPLAILHWPDSLLRQWMGENGFQLWRDWRNGKAGNWLQCRIDRLHQWLADDPHHHLITRLDPEYPQLLRAADGPLLLHCRGQLPLLSSKQLAIVGSRKPTAAGSKMAQWFSADLARAGWVITSGLALGIDGLAHAACLDAGGQTIAVLACGLDRIYPSRHQGLAERIAMQGLLVSEFCLGVEAQTGYFPKRNRIISGLTEATLVVEAAQKSGSLITARLAAEQGREVFAVPGSPLNALAEGCNSLIRDGAQMVCEPSHLLACLAGPCVASGTRPQPRVGDNLDRSSEQLLQLIGLERVALEQLLTQSGLPLGELQRLLLQLELQGLVKCSDAGYERTL